MALTKLIAMSQETTATLRILDTQLSEEVAVSSFPAEDDGGLVRYHNGKIVVVDDINSIGVFTVDGVLVKNFSLRTVAIPAWSAYSTSTGFISSSTNIRPATVQFKPNEDVMFFFMQTQPVITKVDYSGTDPVVTIIPLAYYNTPHFHSIFPGSQYSVTRVFGSLVTFMSRLSSNDYPSQSLTDIPVYTFDMTTEILTVVSQLTSADIQSFDISESVYEDGKSPSNTYYTLGHFPIRFNNDILISSAASSFKSTVTGTMYQTADTNILSSPEDMFGQSLSALGWSDPDGTIVPVTVTVDGVDTNFNVTLFTWNRLYEVLSSITNGYSAAHSFSKFMAFDGVFSPANVRLYEYQFNPTYVETAATITSSILTYFTATQTFTPKSPLLIEMPALPTDFVEEIQIIDGTDLFRISFNSTTFSINIQKFDEQTHASIWDRTWALEDFSLSFPSWEDSFGIRNMAAIDNEFLFWSDGNRVIKLNMDTGVYSIVKVYNTSEWVDDADTGFHVFPASSKIISGSVIQDGLPAIGRIVYLMDGSRQVTSTVTDGSGNFEFTYYSDNPKELICESVDRGVVNWQIRSNIVGV